MAQAQNIRQTRVADEVPTTGRDENVKDFFKAVTVLAIIVVGYFQFAPERNAAHEVAVAAEQVALASAKK